MRAAFYPSPPSSFYPGLAGYIETSIEDFPIISNERRHALNRIAAYVDACVKTGKNARLTFVCTHNSRRSQMAQIWAHTAAVWYGVPQVHTFSGGSEVTAFDVRAIRALVRAGFRIDQESRDNNSIFWVKSGPDRIPVEAFSKLYNDPVNPSEDFCAVMTCTEADRTCPMPPGAVGRVVVPYRDPKWHDDLPDEIRRYDDCCRQISAEMFWIFSRL
ncbi:MAG: protein-tyrosine-phosphatase [candidate division Zixibacteria bacterium]|nr:protein-tyrosine-phosphatase [candidate division Zixibacteria bacterium]